ncbi:hypothetical protein WKI65_32580 [Streptomyces sp. MS1.AVA.3]|uniref:hypothetical protein n=1 Tax=Streptomyces decoyicus TaxID=249567 RepID=UPI0030C44F58
MTSSEYDEYDATVRVPKGADLSQSRRTSGAHRGLTRDPGTNKLAHAEIFLKRKNETDSLTDSPPALDNTYEDALNSRSRDELEELLVALVFLVKETAPHLKKWWNDQAFPFVKSTRERLTRTRKANSQAAPTESTTLMESRPSEASPEVILNLEGDRVRMSSAEARERFAVALMAKIFSEEQMRMLRNARVEDENGPLELSAMEALVPQEIDDRVRLMLEVNASLINEETLAEFGKFLERSRVGSGSAELTNENIIEALRLTDGSS